MQEIENYLKTHEDAEMHPSDIAKLLKELDDEDFRVALKLIPKSMIGDVALALPDRYFEDVVENLSVDELLDAINELETDDQAEFLEELEYIDQNVAAEVFKKLDEENKEEIETILSYDDDEAGAYMQLEVFTSYEDEVVQNVIKRFAKLRKEHQLENVQNLFVVDRRDKLLYAVGLDDLLIFDFSKTIKENIEESEESFEPKIARDEENIKEVVHYFEEYDLSVMPIVNGDGKLLGRITSDDIYDIINEHATEQMYNLAGVNDEAEEEDVLKAGQKRASWLAVNLLTAIAASFVIGMFEQTLQSLVALAILMPIVASMGGNAGTQTLTVVVRQLALGDISNGDAMRIMKKEIFIALMNGAIFALAMGLIAWVWFDISKLGLVIGLSMIINLFMAGFFGAVVPLGLKTLKIDPAIGSTVILTTVTDVVGFFSFLGLATYILL
ncbi:MAG: magnesium transporter [Campylobacterales bacterium]|nr:magnesium transporter [Campylobacterales bacterium]